MLMLEAGQSVTVVIGATGVGTGEEFMVRPRPDGPPTVEFQPTTPPAAFTALTADLESSTDGGVTFRTYPGGASLSFLAAPVHQVLNLVPGRIYRLNIRTFAGGANVSINATTSGLPAGLVDFRKLEYERAAIRYHNIYESMWQIFSYMTAIAAAILTFGADRFQPNFLVALACLPLTFWFWATYLPLDAYGKNCLNTLKDIERRINDDWPGARLSHYRDFRDVTARENGKIESVRLAVCIGAGLLQIALLWNTVRALQRRPWTIQKASETKVTITNLGELKKIQGSQNAHSSVSHQAPPQGEKPHTQQKPTHPKKAPRRSAVEKHAGLISGAALS